MHQRYGLVRGEFGAFGNRKRVDSNGWQQSMAVLKRTIDHIIVSMHMAERKNNNNKKILRKLHHKVHTDVGNGTTEWQNGIAIHKSSELSQFNCIPVHASQFHIPTPKHTILPSICIEPTMCWPSMYNNSTAKGCIFRIPVSFVFTFSFLCVLVGIFALHSLIFHRHSSLTLLHFHT